MNDDHRGARIKVEIWKLPLAAVLGVFLLCGMIAITSLQCRDSVRQIESTTLAVEGFLGCRISFPET